MTEIRLINYFFLLLFLLLFESKDALAYSKQSYVFLYEQKVNEVRISKEKNTIKCLEDIIDISFNNGVKPALEFNGKIVTFNYPFSTDTQMTIKTSKRFYEVLLKPDKDVGPVVMLAKQTLKDAPSAKGYEYLTTKGLNYIRISNNEINRVSCDHKDVKIEKVILPTDSGIEKESDGSNAYIRYRGQKDVVVHITTTSGKVYSACLKPAKVDAKTLILKNSNSTDSIIGLYGNKREEVVVELIKSAITNINDLSEARITQKSKNITTIDQIKIKEHARYQFDTDGIILIEYDLTLIPKVETKVHIDEEYLYDKYFKNIDKNSGNIMGLGLNNDYVYPNRNTSLFVVFRSHHLNE